MAFPRISPQGLDSEQSLTPPQGGMGESSQGPWDEAVDPSFGKKPVMGSRNAGILWNIPPQLMRQAGLGIELRIVSHQLRVTRVPVRY